MELLIEICEVSITGMLMKKTEDLPDIMMMRKITTENDRKRNHLRMIRRKEDRKKTIRM